MAKKSKKKTINKNLATQLKDQVDDLGEQLKTQVDDLGELLDDQFRALGKRAKNSSALSDAKKFLGDLDSGRSRLVNQLGLASKSDFDKLDKKLKSISRKVNQLVA